MGQRGVLISEWPHVFLGWSKNWADVPQQWLQWGAYLGCSPPSTFPNKAPFLFDSFRADIKDEIGGWFSWALVSWGVPGLQPHPPSASYVGPSCCLAASSPEKQLSLSSASLQSWLPWGPGSIVLHLAVQLRRAEDTSSCWACLRVKNPCRLSQELASQPTLEADILRDE